MQTNKKSILSGTSEEIILATELLSEEPKAGAPVDDKRAALQDMLLKLLSNKLAEEENEKKMKVEEAQKLLIARTQDFKRAQEIKVWTQENCDHRKEDGRSRLGGQRLSNGDTLYICQLCFKTWNQVNMPRNLQIDPNWIGG
jgi:hypothetical protein